MGRFFLSGAFVWGFCAAVETQAKHELRERQIKETPSSGDVYSGLTWSSRPVQQGLSTGAQCSIPPLHNLSLEFVTGSIACLQFFLRLSFAG